MNSTSFCRRNCSPPRGLRSGGRRYTTSNNAAAPKHANTIEPAGKCALREHSALGCFDACVECVERFCDHRGLLKPKSEWLSQLSVLRGASGFHPRDYNDMPAQCASRGTPNAAHIQTHSARRPSRTIADYTTLLVIVRNISVQCLAPARRNMHSP